MKVIKRDGFVVDFNVDKIKTAIFKAKKEVGSALEVDKVVNLVSKLIESKEVVAVEYIQDCIFDAMVSLGESRLAREFERYRTRRTVEREKQLEKLYSDMHRIITDGARENSNKDSRLHGVNRDLVAGEFFRNTLVNDIPKNVYEAHCKKIIHWHDADYSRSQTNCCVFNLSDMLENGTKILNAEIETPRSIQVATNVSMQIMANISAVQYGGVSLANFNETLAKYAKMNFRKHFIDVYRIVGAFSSDVAENRIKDIEKAFGVIDSSNMKLKEQFEYIFAEAITKTDKDIYDSCQLFEYQTNSILGSASQTPFSTITFNIPTSWESERIIWNYLQVRMQGLGKEGRIAIFPKISMIVVDGYNLKKGDKYYYLLQEASKCIAKTYYPDLLLYSKEDYLSGNVYARMGCRSRVNSEYRENGKPVQEGRANYGVVTLNLNHLCLEALKKQGGLKEFLEKIDYYSDTIMRDAFQARYDNVSKMKAQQEPILFVDGGIARLNPEDTIESLLRSDKLSLSYGFVGLDDCVRMLTDNKENISTKLGHQIGKHIMDCVVNNVNKLKKEMDLPISLYGSPNEASIATLFEKDKETFGDIMPKWLLDREYYTNSFHFSSELPIDPFEKIKVESEFSRMANGGNISYVENGGKVYNTKAIIQLIQYAYKCGTQYFAINTISDVCYECGYTGEMKYDIDKAQYTCPNCGNKDGRKMKVQRRCCGYIANYNITHGVKGRMKEIESRFVHTK